MVAGAGFEPATFGLWARRASELLYPAIFNALLLYSIILVLSILISIYFWYFNQFFCFIFLQCRTKIMWCEVYFCGGEMGVALMMGIFLCSVKSNKKEHNNRAVWSEFPKSCCWLLGSTSVCYVLLLTFNVYCYVLLLTFTIVLFERRIKCRLKN